MRWKKVLLSIGIFSVIFLCLLFLDYKPLPELSLTIKYSENNDCQLFYGKKTDELNEHDSNTFSIPADEETEIKLDWDYSDELLRIDFGNQKQNIVISSLVMGNRLIKDSLPIKNMIGNHEVIYSSNDNKIEVVSMGKDPYVYFELSDTLSQLENQTGYVMKILYLVLSLIVALCAYFRYDYMKILIFWAVDILKNMKLIIELAISDFKTRYAASYLGMVWAFVQPIVTIVIYVIVFGYGFKTTPINEFPFVLWLVAGIVPWFFFSDALLSATNSLKEYSYLVKKVVFEIKILPLVKIMAAIIIHLFFVGVAIILYIFNGYMPTVYYLQIIYYMFCTIALVLGLSYLTSSLNVFVPDLGQIINIALQFGMWMTPIMWSSNIFGEKAMKLIQINPFYYIVEGYRDCFYNNVGFWEKPGLTIYFWSITIICLILGMYAFRKLEKHFADVL